MSGAQHTPGWIPAARRLPEQYREVRVRLADGVERIARLNAHGGWEQASFHPVRHQYIVAVAEWFDEKECVNAHDGLVEALRKNIDLMVEVAQELKQPRMPLATSAAASVRLLANAAKDSLAAIAKATGSAEPRDCDECEGTGLDADFPTICQCPVCFGTGKATGSAS